MAQPELILLYTTVPDSTTGEKIARALLEKKSIACANILPPHTALYAWEGEIQQDQEQVMLLKTTPQKFNEVEKVIQQLHPYECPCLLEIPVTKAHSDFKKWVQLQIQ